MDSQTNSILFLTDESDEPARIGLDVTASGVHYYLIRFKLAAHETRAIDFRALRDSQVPDFKGNRIPAGASDGSANWVRLDDAPVEGRMMVIQQQQGMASNFDCSTCYCPAKYTALAVAPIAFGLLPAAYEDMGSTATYYSCNTGTYYYDVTVASTWSSDNTPVIQMNSSVRYRADAIAGGTANVMGSFTDCTQFDTNPDFDCPCISDQNKSASGVGAVQAPEYVGVGNALADTVQCGTTNYFARRLTVPYTVLDSNKAAIARAGMSVQEHLSWTSSACATSNGCGQQPSAATWTTNSSGGFTDTIYNCSATCENSGSCSEDWQQTFTVNGGSVGIVNGSTVGTVNCVATDCSSTPQGTIH